MKGIVYTWDSDSNSKRLTSQEAEALFNVSWRLFHAGKLVSEHYRGTNQVIFWQRCPKELTNERAIDALNHSLGVC